MSRWQAFMWNVVWIVWVQARCALRNPFLCLYYLLLDWPVTLFVIFCLPRRIYQGACEAHIEKAIGLLWNGTLPWPRPWVCRRLPYQFDRYDWSLK